MKQTNRAEQVCLSKRDIYDDPSLLRLNKQKKDDEDERLLSIFKQIHIYLPFLEAMIHMPKGAKVLKDILFHKEKLEKAASSVKLSEECFTIVQRSLLQKEGDPKSARAFLTAKGPIRHGSKHKSHATFSLSTIKDF
ncbi:hypothetical protein Tco_0584957 [Tanacetum coccineum]